jgi:hypothetical protein
MVTGFELVGLIGALSATLDLVNKTISVVRAYAGYNADMGRLLIRLQANEFSIRRFLNALKSLQSGGTQQSVLTDQEVELLTALSNDLDLILAKLSFKLQRFETDNTKALDKMKWAVWRKASFGRDQVLLDDWAQRIGMIYASIEASLTTQRRSLHATDLSADRMARLVSGYEDIRDRSQGDGQSLCVEFNRLHLLGTPSRRMPARLQGHGSSVSVTSVLVEYMAKGWSQNLNQGEVEQIGEATLALAKVLKYSEPKVTGLPRCHGYFKDERSLRYGLVYELPSDMMWSNDPKTSIERVLSLRQLLNINPRFPLDQRLRLCCDIAKAVLYVHLVGWVHKSIRPDNIILLQPKESSAIPQFPYALTDPVLAGFEYARATAEGALSDRKSDADWTHNIYRHPKRQGIERNEQYNMTHDVYSLGVVLLEVGMWGIKGFKPFQHADQGARFAGVDGEKRKTGLLAIANGIPDKNGERYPLTTAMGSRFDQLVLYCLNIDEQTSLPPAAFMQRIWMELDEMRAATASR